MMVSAKDAARYLKRYVEIYRKEFKRFTNQPPVGPGYPVLPISPYLDSNELTCYLANDGAAVADLSRQPDYRWEIAGGPALLVDLPNTRTPPEIFEYLRRDGLLGKNIGIYRIVSKGGLPEEIWSGKLPKPRDCAEFVAEKTIKIMVYQYDISWASLIQRLTFGAFCNILDLRLPGRSSDLWSPRIIRDLGFCTADRHYKRFFHYLELLPHVEKTAWDSRSIWVRVNADIRRDYAHYIGNRNAEGVSLSLERPEVQLESEVFDNRLSALRGKIDEFEKLLEEHCGDDEDLFHRFLEGNPILLDIYGKTVSKPRFYYPAGESPQGKLYVEPDFIIRYPGNTYKLVELERPSKRLATRKGEPRSEVNQAVFQIGEWRAFILNHYDTLKDQFPGISTDCSYMVVISRSHLYGAGTGRNLFGYKQILGQMYPGNEILTYDDLLIRAKQAYLQLSILR